jgi:hypothetical protein
MKQLFLTLIVALLTVGATAAESDTLTTAKSATTEKSSAGKKATREDSTYVPTYTDTTDDGKTVVSTSVDTDVDPVGYDDDDESFDLSTVMSNFTGGHKSSLYGFISFVSFLVLMIPTLFLLLPIIILILIFRYFNKRRRERYALIEKALDKGQPLPSDIAGKSEAKSIVKDMTDGRAKGIRNMCLGGGLFVFLWAVTGSFGFGCIGVLVFARGLGQYLTSPKVDASAEQKAEQKPASEQKPTSEPTPEQKPDEESKPEQTPGDFNVED